MKTYIACAATAALLSLGFVAMSSGPVAARVVCNAEGDCWHTDHYYHPRDVHFEIHTTTTGTSTAIGIMIVTAIGAAITMVVAIGITASGLRSDRSGALTGGGIFAAPFLPCDSLANKAFPRYRHTGRPIWVAMECVV